MKIALPYKVAFSTYSNSFNIILHTSLKVQHLSRIYKLFNVTLCLISSKGLTTNKRRDLTVDFVDDTMFHTWPDVSHTPPHDGADGNSV